MTYLTYLTYLTHLVADDDLILDTRHVGVGRRRLRGRLSRHSPVEERAESGLYAGALLMREQ